MATRASSGFAKMRTSANTNLAIREVTPAVIISIDTEQIWGHFDLFGESEFRRRYPDSTSIHDRLLHCLCAAGISATWTVVGGLSLAGSQGAADPLFTGLPRQWVARV